MNVIVPTMSTNTSPKKGFVMIVDDVLENANVAAMMLRTQGFSALAFSNSHEFFQALLEQTPDVILLDIAMPYMNGIEVCERLKANPATSDIPVIFLTVHTGQQYIANAYNAGAAGFLAKPIELRELLTHVKKHIASHTIHGGV